MTPVWFLLMVVSAGGHTADVKMMFDTQDQCKAKYEFAQKTAEETHAKVKGSCLPGPRPHLYGQQPQDEE